MRYLISMFLLVFIVINTNAQRTCSTMQVHEELLKQDPTYRDRLEAQERHIQQQQGAADRGVSNVITIPVVFHIVHNGDAVGTNENLSDALIAAQLDQMNQDFALANSDFSNTPAVFQGLASNTMIQFCMAERTPDCQSTNGIHRYNGGQADWTTAAINSTLKPATIWDRDQYLNIWTVNFDASSTLLGYAQFPGGTANTDGVVVRYTSVGSLTVPNPDGAPYNLGRTMTHEVGHWLSLYHIWGDDGTACTGSDLCADTPNQADENGGCPTFPQVSCSNGPNGDMFVNYMDYTDDDCMHMFSNDQGDRMYAVLNGGLRSSLVTSEGCLPPSLSCLYCTATADQSGNEKISNVTFADINHNSSSTNGYENLVSVVGNVTQGSSYAFSASLTNGWPADQMLTWIDFNQDGDFSDAGEQVFTSGVGAGPYSTTIAIPSGATLGTTRMRVRLHDTSDGPNYTPCGTSTWGQVEDYSLEIAVAAPVELTQFTAVPNGQQVVLKWTTELERNNLGYSVERSVNDINHFEPIGFVAASKSPNQRNDYRHIDSGVKNGQSYYYRLAQQDIDGKVEYSNVRFVAFEKGEEISIKPNPATDNVQISLPEHWEDNTLEVYNANGEMMYRSTAVQNVVIPTASWPEGVYFVKANNGMSHLQKKLVVVGKL